VIQARCHAAMATIRRSDTGWDELEAAWRDAMATETLAEHAGLMGRSSAGPRHCNHNLDRAQSYIAETTAFCAHHDLACSCHWPSPPTGSCSFTAVIGTALPRLPRMC